MEIDKNKEERLKKNKTKYQQNQTELKPLLNKFKRA